VSQTDVNKIKVTLGVHYVGHPCIRCGGTVRFLKGKKGCVACARLNKRSSPSNTAEAKRQRRLANREQTNATKRRYRQAHASDINLSRRRAYAVEAEASAPERAAKKAARAEAMRQIREARKAEKDAKRRAREASRLTEQEKRHRLLMHWRVKRSQTRAFIRGTSKEAKLTTAQARWLLDAQDHKCAYCGSDGESRFGIHLDHKHALSEGGAHTLANCQFLCGTCNMSKRTRDDATYRAAKRIPQRTDWDAPAAAFIARLDEAVSWGEMTQAQARAAKVPPPCRTERKRLPPEELARRKAERKRKARLKQRAAKTGRTVADQKFEEAMRRIHGRPRAYTRAPALCITVVQAGAVTVLAF
jgi:5-methylcytosine-specific restriction endonuclease McrA